MSDASPVPARPRRKQAIVLVHGMGEQMPMETLRGFVQTMWVEHPTIKARRDTDPGNRNPVWWKPDPRVGSYELAGITTRGIIEGDGPEGPRTDFYEFYWADITAANTLDQLRDWFMSVMIRRPSQVPDDVKVAWYVLWGLTLAAALFALAYAADAAGVWEAPSWWGGAAAAVLLVYGVVQALMLQTFGDVARYVRAKPPNISARRDIRERGLALLRQLSACGEYDRIVLVGHSLGSIVAYDLLKLFWSEREAARTMVRGDAVHRAWEDVATASTHVGRDPATFRAAQHRAFEAMSAVPDPGQAWLISDFVTVGSPLAHASFLLARDKDAFHQGVCERRFPICPPFLEDPAQKTFLFELGGGRWRAHHGAVFGAVRWTNVCDPATAIVFGDFVSGRVQPLFGEGVSDRVVKVRASWIPRRFFTHTSYWTAVGADAPQLPVLRDALDLSWSPRRPSP